MITIAVMLVALVITVVLLFELSAFVALTPVWVWIFKKLLGLIIIIAGYKIARWYWKNYQNKDAEKK